MRGLDQGLDRPTCWVIRNSLCSAFDRDQFSFGGARSLEKLEIFVLGVPTNPARSRPLLNHHRRLIKRVKRKPISSLPFMHQKKKAFGPGELNILELFHSAGSDS